MMTPQQMRDVIVNRRLRIEPVDDKWTVKSPRGERITKDLYPTPELAVEEAEKILLAFESRSQSTIAVEVVEFLSRGEGYVVSQLVPAPSSDNPSRNIEQTIFHGIITKTGEVVISGPVFVVVALNLRDEIERRRVVVTDNNQQKSTSGNPSR